MDLLKWVHCATRARPSLLRCVSDNEEPIPMPIMNWYVPFVFHDQQDTTQDKRRDRSCLRILYKWTTWNKSLQTVKRKMVLNLIGQISISCATPIAGLTMFGRECQGYNTASTRDVESAFEAMDGSLPTEYRVNVKLDYLHSRGR